VRNISENERRKKRKKTEICEKYMIENVVEEITTYRKR
jgi:hypothetical protein